MVAHSTTFRSRASLTSVGCLLLFVACAKSTDVTDPPSDAGQPEAGVAGADVGGAAGGGAAGEAGEAGSAGTGGATCEIPSLSDACLDCIADACDGECVACSAVEDCSPLIACYQGCGDDDACAGQCKAQHTNATGLVADLGRCAGPDCGSVCPLFEGMGGGGGASGAGGSAGASGAGGAAGASGAAGSGTGGTGGVGGTGGTGGAGGTGGTGGVGGTGGTGGVGGTGGTGGVGGTGGTGGVGGTGGTGGVGGTGGTGGGTCGAYYLTDPCETCVDTQCLPECTPCVADTSCSLLFECFASCNSIFSCEVTCQNTYPQAQSLFEPLKVCLQQSCSGTC
jgi:hypothetical protein